MGTKRRVESGSNAEALDPTLRSKRIVAASPLDPLRARSSQQNVRALNTQFASWIQSQIQNHPDELWQDGVQAYLDHASQIMEKFSDVVEWLKANAASQDKNSSDISSSDLGKKEVTELKAGTGLSFLDSKSVASLKTNVFPTPLFGNSGLSQGFSNTGFLSNWGSTPFSANQVSAQGSLTTVGAAEDDDDDNDTDQPSSPSLKKIEEQGVVVVHEVKCKLYVKPDNPEEKGWKDMGVGQLCIKCKEGVTKATKESKPTVVIRNDVGKLLLNALIYPSIKMNIQKNTITTIFHTLMNEDANGSETRTPMARTYLLRTKTEEEINNLADAIRDHAPPS